ncbi:uncharacterized protein LOC142598086 [Dermatophagoides farinae]|uniref:uncharacterized protein LOC142598086 n=1 Tax=Dermatophagoides farinae TaxID=6954 RepID=UPI003F62E386
MARKTETQNTAKLRIAIINANRCKPKKCNQECRKFCPVVRVGKQCIEVTPASKIAYISEILCIGCGICTKKCPFEAIQIINLPKDLSSDVSHRYGENSFKLHRLPQPRPGVVLSLLGRNGMGKSTAVAILSGKCMPNLGKIDDPPTWKDIIKYYRGSDLQNYFTQLSKGDLRVVVKPQYVDAIAKKSMKKVRDLVFKESSELSDFQKSLIHFLEIEKLYDRNISDLSGGELQRFSILITLLNERDIYIIDEPSSYLDIKQRMNAARLIRERSNDSNYVICVEHDLAVCDYLSDMVCALWGHASAYGVISQPMTVKEGINNYLNGFLPSENMRFRDEAISFHMAQEVDDFNSSLNRYKYPAMKKTLGSFSLTIDPGSFSDSQITVLLGQNGTGKTTFIRILAGLLAPDDDSVQFPKLSVSYKPQMISAKFEGTVEELFMSRIRESYTHPQFIADCVKPMDIDELKSLYVKNLSGGELQRVALVLALGKPADLYLLDEPSAYLDCERRIDAARMIKRFILHSKKAAFVVEHDFVMASYLADRVIVYEGEPGIDSHANTPQHLVQGMNKFLQILDTTFRRDTVNYRPRINKYNSLKDREQKLSGQYFVVDTN